ncbi:hypothetical protein IAD21_05414 [Abditibacteriota bacterium]|nr:hypothetical protein IAD21_05414 [Abditibacteriota bacterium]
MGTPRSLIALVGLPGAGKSTLAARLEEAVNERAGEGTMVVLGMDGFHLTKAQLEKLPDPECAFARRGSPWTFDAHLMAERLRCIKQAGGHESVWWPDFQHDVGDPIENVHEIGPDVRLVLVEGLYLLHKADGWDEVCHQFDEHWCLDTPLEVALERLTLRHMRVWQLTREEAQRRIARNDQFNANIVMDSCSRADWRIMDG